MKRLHIILQCILRIENLRFNQRQEGKRYSSFLHSSGPSEKVLQFGGENRFTRFRQEYKQIYFFKWPWINACPTGFLENPTALSTYIHLRRQQNFKQFWPLPPPVGNFLLLSFGKFDQFLTPFSLKKADVLNEWSLNVECEITWKLRMPKTNLL